MKSSGMNIARTGTRKPPTGLQAEIEHSPDLTALAEKVAQNPQLLAELFDGLQADKAKVKYGCLKVLRIISELCPTVLYPSFDRFVSLLDSRQTIIKWGAIIITGNLARVDSEQKIDAILGRFLEPIAGPVMITAANTIHAAGKIAAAKPHLADRISATLLQVENAHYATPECRNVALGHVVDALEQLAGHVTQPALINALLQRQIDNPRKAVARRAAKLLARLTPKAASDR